MTIYRDPRIRKVPTDETRRQGEFLAAAALIVFLRWLPPWASIALALALVGYFGWLSPRLFPATVRPEESGEPYPLGKTAYAGMVFFLVVFFRHRLFVAAGAWAILAAGDAAATLVGARFPLVRHLWNPEKSLGGTLAFVVAGGIAGFLAVQWVNYPPAPFPWRFALAASLPAAALGAIVESLPLPVDDNVTVPVAAAVFLALYTHPYLLQANHSIW